VVLLLQDQDDVPGLHTGRLVGLPAERDLLAVLHALVHVHLQDLHLLHHLLALALFTAVFLADHLAWEEELVSAFLSLNLRLSAEFHRSAAPHLRRYSQCTPTASVGPSRAPAV